MRLGYINIYCLVYLSRSQVGKYSIREKLHPTQKRISAFCQTKNKRNYNEQGKTKRKETKKLLVPLRKYIFMTCFGISFLLVQN